MHHKNKATIIKPQTILTERNGRDLPSSHPSRHVDPFHIASHRDPPAAPQARPADSQLRLLLPRLSLRQPAESPQGGRLRARALLDHLPAASFAHSRH